MHRMVKDWRYFKVPFAYHLFSYLIFEADEYNEVLNGVNVTSYKVVTTLRNISNETGISFQTVRTLLSKFVATGEIKMEVTQYAAQQDNTSANTIRPRCNTSCKTIITISKYEFYQKLNGSKKDNCKKYADDVLTQRGNTKPNTKTKEKVPPTPPLKEYNSNMIIQEEKNNPTTPLTGSVVSGDELEFERFNKWIATTCPSILKMKEQLTIKQYVAIRDEYGKPIMIKACERMHNWSGLVKNCTSVNLTMRERIRRLLKDEQPTKQQPAKTKDVVF